MPSGIVGLLRSDGAAEELRRDGASCVELRRLGIGRGNPRHRAERGGHHGAREVRGLRGGEARTSPRTSTRWARTSDARSSATPTAPRRAARSCSSSPSPRSLVVIVGGWLVLVGLFDNAADPLHRQRPVVHHPGHAPSSPPSRAPSRSRRRRRAASPATSTRSRRRAPARRPTRRTPSRAAQPASSPPTASAAALRPAGLAPLRLEQRDRDAPGLPRPLDDRPAAPQRLRPSGADRLIGEAAHRACRRASPAGARAAGHGPREISSASPAAEPSSQTTTPTSPQSSRTVPGRSGSASAASNPAPSIASSPSGVRLVPRTCQPRAASRAPSSRPRQPQPTISARANLRIVVVSPPPSANGPRPARPHRLILRGLPLHVRLGDLLRAPLSPQRVLRLDHLAYVVDLVLGLELGRARRLPVEQVGDAVPLEQRARARP